MDGLDLTRVLSLEAKTVEEAWAARTIRAEQFRPTLLAGVWPTNRPADFETLFSRKQAAWRSLSKRLVTEDGRDLGYDLEEDPREVHPFPGSRLDLEVHVPDPGEGGGGATLSEDEVNALKALGYL
jgi:hypothetical protein